MDKNLISKAYFTLHKRRTAIAGHAVARSMIVLKDKESGLIIRVTDYADHAFYLRNELHVHAEDPDRLYAVWALTHGS